nr:MotA/TolQ/ExbB proton channel family protein [uncultured Sulfurimonas sp.]
MKKYKITITITSIYAVTILLPYYLTSVRQLIDSKNYFLELHYGFIHYPSIIFICLSAIILHLSVKASEEKVYDSHKKTRAELAEAVSMISLNNENFDEFLKTKNKFSKDIKTIILNGGIEDDMELIVQKRTLEISTMYEKLISEYGYISTVLPMLGMVGTITGLLQMFAVSDGIDNITEKLASLSVALATTLYATLWVILITKPNSREVENHLIELDKEELNLINSAKLFLHNVDVDLLIEFDVKKEEVVSENKK